MGDPTPRRTRLLLVVLLLLAVALAGCGGDDSPATPTGSPTGSKSADLPPLDAVGRAITGTPGLTHYYPLTTAYGARDAVGGLDGTDHGARFTDQGADFDGKSYVSIPDDDDFSASTTGALTVVAFLEVTDWHGADASEYVHWLSKGGTNEFEWAFRHYVQDGSGQAESRQGRVSFYYFNPDGGQGAGSYYQDGQDDGVHQVVATVDRTHVAIWKDGDLRDRDPLSGYDIEPRNTTSDVRVGAPEPSPESSAGALVGTVSHLAFFDRRLSGSEIEAIYAAWRG